jgi:tetraacyldisaccharide 4'-kinase
MNWLINSWYRLHPIRWLLWPLSLLYRLIIWCRQALYNVGIFKQYRFPVPVIIVGNITVGGTGKTPFVIWLVKQLKRAGLQPGIISRGYGGKADHYPQLVSPQSDPGIVGDEPIIISRHTGCPMVVSPNRVAASMMLLQQSDCNIVIADDGLQHYALGRDIEIVVADGQRLFGNQYCLPAGPLREPLSRLKRIDFMVHNGNPLADYNMELLQGQAINLADSELKKDLSHFINESVHAIAGIGNPQRFFNQLSEQGLTIQPHAFFDHHRFVITDLQFDDNKPILMTEKDSVKCQSFANKNMWFIPIEATISGKLEQQILQKLAGLSSHG